MKAPGMNVRELIEHLQAADPEAEVQLEDQEGAFDPVAVRSVHMPYGGPVVLSFIPTDPGATTTS